MRILHDLPLCLSIVHGGRDYIKRAESSAAEISANIHENLLELREKAYRPMQL